LDRANLDIANFVFDLVQIAVLVFDIVQIRF